MPAYPPICLHRSSDYLIVCFLSLSIFFFFLFFLFLTFFSSGLMQVTKPSYSRRFKRKNLASRFNLRIITQPQLVGDDLRNDGSVHRLSYRTRWKGNPVWKLVPDVIGPILLPHANFAIMNVFPKLNLNKITQCPAPLFSSFHNISKGLKFFLNLPQSTVCFFRNCFT